MTISGAAAFPSSTAVGAIRLGATTIIDGHGAGDIPSAGVRHHLAVRTIVPTLINQFAAASEYRPKKPDTRCRHIATKSPEVTLLTFFQMRFTAGSVLPQ